MWKRWKDRIQQTLASLTGTTTSTEVRPEYGRDLYGHGRYE